MGILPLVRYLLGSREAIREIAGNRHALWIGLLFVLSAGFAREYDGEDLLHEPWYVVIPVGASFLLFLLAFGVAAGKRGVTWRQFLPGYLSFLGLFWMTAPLAWLYAVPYEQFLSPVDAMRANLWTLGVVSAWRVSLMARVLVVLFRYSHFQAFFLVLGFATLVAMVVIVTAPVPLVGVMSGSRLSSERDQVMADVAQVVMGLGCWMILLWPICAMFVLNNCSPSCQLFAAETARPGSLPWLALASLAVWPFVLPHTQPQQQRRREVEKLFAKGNIGEALATVSRHSQSDYPPGWDPPPRVMRFHWPWEQGMVLDVLEELAKSDHAEWVRESYLDRLATALNNVGHLDEKDLLRLANSLQSIPGGRAVVDRASGRPRSGSSDDTIASLQRLLDGQETKQQEAKGVDKR